MMLSMVKTRIFALCMYRQHFKEMVNVDTENEIFVEMFLAFKMAVIKCQENV